jgi:hypothetical protein
MNSLRLRVFAPLRLIRELKMRIEKWQNEKCLKPSRSLRLGDLAVAVGL